MSGGAVVRKLLYVEDNEDNLYMLQLWFDVLGEYEILSATDGAAGLAIAVGRARGGDPLEALRERLLALGRSVVRDAPRCPADLVVGQQERAPSWKCGLARRWASGSSPNG